METNRVAPADATAARLDAEFYGLAFRRAAAAVRRLGALTNLEAVRARSVPIRRGIDMPRFTGDPTSPRMVTIAAFDDPSIDFSGLEGIESTQHAAFRASELAAGDLVVAMGGYVGRAAICPPNPPLANIGRHSARVVVDPLKADVYFLWAFLTSTVGELQLRRQVTGSVQAGVNLEDLRIVELPNPNPLAQRYIGDKVRQAERLRERARKLRADIAKVFSAAGFAAAVAPAERIGRIRSSELVDRLDALHYRVDLLRNLESFRRHPTVQLGSRVDFDGLADGDHGNPIYGQGPIYVRATELNGGVLDPDTDVRLDEVYASPLPSSVWATSDDVLFSIVATLGAVGVLDEASRAVLSRGVAKVRPITLPKHYVKAYMRTATFGSELLRRSVGTIQRGVYLESLQSLEVPVLPKAVVDFIAAKEAAADRCIVASRSLTCASKLFVERLIDSVISESDLVAAQKALEAGDRNPDRALLNALRRNDAPDAAPVFTDVDDLYALLDAEDISRGAD